MTAMEAMVLLKLYCEETCNWTAYGFQYMRLQRVGLTRVYGRTTVKLTKKGKAVVATMLAAGEAVELPIALEASVRHAGKKRCR